MLYMYLHNLYILEEIVCWKKLVSKHKVLLKKKQIPTAVLKHFYLTESDQ